MRKVRSALVIFLVFFSSLLFFVPLSFSWTPHTNQWSSPNYSFRVNSVNFSNNINGISLSEVQWRAWIFYALAQWKSTTGLEWNFKYQGTTSASGCHPIGSSMVSDNQNTIDASAGCQDTMCTTLGTHKWWGSGSNKSEADVCIWGGAATFKTRTDMQPSSGIEYDLISILVHEFGHVIGLLHESNTVMASNAYPNSVKGRFPTYDDIEGARDVFPGTSNFNKIRQWRKRTGSNTWSSAYTIPSANQWLEISGALGRTSNLGDVVIVSGTNVPGTTTRFSRATYPLSSSSSWPNVNWSYSTWRRPAIASSGYNSQEWVAAITNPSLLNACSGIRIFRSTTGFTSGSVLNLSSECTNNAPALAYDYNSKRFILLYIQKSDTLPQNLIIARTSTDGGFTWTPAQNIGIAAMDTPSIACKPGSNQCTLAYQRASVDTQHVVTRSISVNPTNGNITLGSYLQDTNWVQRPPLVGYSTKYADWMLGIHHPPSEAARANALGRVYTTTSPSSPISYGSFPAVTSEMTLPANFISADIYQDDYLIYTDY